ncbi:hypothetical protein NBRC10512_005042 [Rhodotorula toruloides]|uniref:RHTO0S01e15676g1_1 n=2 Tax=Rhodotorula toruloides TaxID=5286 RepID=A0A061ALE9_RHOTO|nr:zinc finger, C2H2-type domain containing protein [Rhodotorula toruloides NP11]EMS24391.1 zinc finger, C2H2-type domain containing protein [Rhodotorula toruloides NP11]KAJ8293930.1 Transcription factor IIIA [Rhodotorula toruloides]CDR36166.1 RHTO0S01e15676g1_1 [Rhodotorula toruloides]
MASAVASTSSYVFPHDAASSAALFVSPADLFQRTAPAQSDYEDEDEAAQEPAFEVQEEEVDPRSLLGSLKLQPGETTEMSGGRLKRYMCTWPGCGKCYARPTRLEEHQRVHTGERPFVCSVCNADFQRDSHLKAHSRMHLDESEKPCACPEEGCGKKFWTNQHLNKHVEVVHRNGGKTYKCDECDSTFRKHHQLRSHVLQEHSAEATDIRPFECEHPGCGKSFKQKTHLKSHEKTHDTSRYACMHPSCASLPAESRQFGTWTLLQRHNKTVHPPACHHPECDGRVFANSRSLRNHLSLHERDEKEARGEVVLDENGKKKRRRRNKKRKSSSSDVDEAGAALEGVAAPEQEGEEVEEGSDWEARQESERDERMREDFRHGGKKKRKVFHEAAGFPALPLPPSLAGLANSPALEDIPEGLPVPPAAFLADPSADSSQNIVDLLTGANYSAPQATGSRPALSRSPSKGGLANVPRKYSCPFPAILELPFKDLGQPSRPASPALEEDGDEDDEGTCKYWFKRVYDVERHLKAKHGVEMVGGRQVLDDYFKAEAED